MSTAYHADILVVGAGPGGSALATLLARQGCDVLLVDRARFPRDKTCGDGLTPRAIPVLRRLGVLERLEGAAYQRIEGAQLIPADGEPWTMRFAEHPLGLPPYGLVVPRYDLDMILLEQAIATGARFLPQFNATGPVRGEDGVEGVTGELEGRPAEVRARYTALAVGANIGLLRGFGLLDKMPAGINAIRGYFAGVADPTPFFEFYFESELAPGYGWVFPLADGSANIGLGVWNARGGRQANVKALLQQFIARHPRLNAVEPVSPLKGFPLRIDFPAYRPYGEGWLLVGEAAGLVNPVTGEGIDLALESAELAVPVLHAALSNGKGAAGSLRAYDQALQQRYRSFFVGARVLLRLAMRPAAISILAREAKKKPRLARLIAGINLGITSPWRAFSPLTWWEIMR